MKFGSRKAHIWEKSPTKKRLQYLRTLHVQEDGLKDSWEVVHDDNLHRLQDCDEYGDGVENDLHAYSRKFTEGENKGKFQCSLCGQISKLKDHAFMHVESIHFPGSYEHECEQCGEKFDTKNKLRHHLSRVHYGKK